jgi:GNAT superfamily N-acetyltransferase
MAPSYELVRYEADLKPQVAALQCHLWSPSTALNLAYFEWKHERNPYIEEPLVYLARCNGQVVAMRGFAGTRWRVGAGDDSREFTALYADDLVIAPEHRNRGLLTKVMAKAFEDLSGSPFHYAVNLSPGPLSYLTALTGGWRSVGLMGPMRHLSWRTVLHRARTRLGRRMPLLAPREREQAPFADIDAAWATRSGAYAGLSLEQAPRCAEMAALIARVEDERVRHVRDATYLQWRFQNPLSRYRYLYYGRQSLEGYLVLQEYSSDYADRHVVNIVDWEASSLDIHTELLRAAIALTRERELFIWSATLPATLTGLLVRNGFRLRPEPRSATELRHVLMLRPIRDVRSAGSWLFEDLPLAELRSWDLRMLYSMHG